MKGRLLIFDLDGTLIDSVGGIAHAVNQVRRNYGFEVLDEKVIASFVGDGAKKLMERSLQDVTPPVTLEESVKNMVTHYAAEPLYHTFLYPGVAEGMKQLREAGWILTVLSNKPQTVAEKILSGLGLLPLLAENIGGGAGFPLKPQPEALLYLLKKFDAVPEKSFVIGDNHTDINAAANAGMKSIFCRFGIGEKAGSLPTMEVDDFAELTNILTAEIKK